LAREPIQNQTNPSGAADAVVRERFVRHSVQFASASISLDSLVETLSVKRFKPRTKPVEVRRGELQNSSFDRPSS
jgi:hypothetical protein